MSDSSDKGSIARESLRNANWIVVARYTSISSVGSRGSDEPFGYRVKKNSVVEVSLLDASAAALEIINYRVSVILPVIYWADATCIPSTDETCRFRSFHIRKVVPFTKLPSKINNRNKIYNIK